MVNTLCLSFVSLVVVNDAARFSRSAILGNFSFLHATAEECARMQGCIGSDLTIDCAANAVQVAVAKSMSSIGEAGTYQICETGSSKLTVQEVSGNALDVPLRHRMMEYGRQVDNQTFLEQLPDIDTSEFWQMTNVKGSAAGGVSSSQLYRSANKALWLKTVDKNELNLWQSIVASYGQHMRNFLPLTTLVRVLGVYAIEGGDCSKAQCWIAMLDVVPQKKLGDEELGEDDRLTCDVKPHQISASPRSYASLDRCGEALHSPEPSLGGSSQARTVQFLVQAYLDLCWLASHTLIDFSWLFVRALPHAIGAIEVKGRWWHIGLIDFLMGFGWDHGLRGLGRWAESSWKATRGAKELPKGFSNSVWASPDMYSGGKFNDYPDRQFSMIQAFMSCVELPPVVAGRPPVTFEKAFTLTCPSDAFKLGVSVSDRVARCIARPTVGIAPFLPPPEGLGRKFLEERRGRCIEKMHEPIQKIYQAILNRSSASGGETFAIRQMRRQKAAAEASHHQFKELARLQKTWIADLECSWAITTNNRQKCRTLDVKKWTECGCLRLSGDDERSC